MRYSMRRECGCGGFRLRLSGYAAKYNTGIRRKPEVCMRLTILILVAGILSAATHEKVGQVKEVRGKWCRAGMELKKADDIFLDDDIRYCSPQLSRAERIVITFLKQPPFDRPYDCSSAGLCDKRTKLW